MNPHFQPHNNPPNSQPNPIYPQTHPYNPQQAQPSPNRYPDLPPVQNPQQNQPYPQSHPYKGGAPGYIPPSQYGNIQDGSFDGESSEKAKFEAQMRKLENQLKTGNLSFYFCWSYSILVIGIVMSSYFLVCGLVNEYGRSRLENALAGSYPLWLLVQSYFAISAVTKKNLFFANIACWMMSIYLALSIVAEGFGIVALIAYIRNPNGWLNVLNMYFCFFVTVHLLVHIFVNMINSFKVRKILVERAEVEMKLIEHSFNNNA